MNADRAPQLKRSVRQAEQVFDGLLYESGVNEYAERNILMALQSELFRGDPKLEAAAVSDSAHIVLGAAGLHVGKIQLALIRLDGAAITQDSVYGPATAAAVLAYKKKRNIINRSYQTQADNIVGKMTMASLDSEMRVDELKPVLIVPVFPAPSIPAILGRGGLSLAFGIGGSVALQGRSTFATPASAQPPVQVIISLRGVGSIQVPGGRGGKLVREQGRDPSQPGAGNFFQVAKLRNARVPNKDFEEVDVVADPEVFSYEALNCGQTFFQVRGFPSPTKRSAVMRLLVLVQSAGPSTEPEHPADPNLKSGLVSVQGTPLKPLPGRTINIFGEKESHGFEDYSGDVDHCTTGSARLGGIILHRPWTADPRTPPGIGDKSVSNICGRGSPMHPVTIAEILRIGRPGCRVTYADATGNLNVERLRAGLKGAKVVEEGVHDGNGRAIVFELT